MDRKKFIKLISAGTLCTGALAGFTGCATYRYIDAVRLDNRLAVSRFGWEEEPFVMIRHPQRRAPIYLARHPESGYIALSLECTHKQCTVDPAGGHFQCPCHGSRYSGEGRVLEGPAREDLEAYEVTFDDKKIYIRLS